MSLVIAFNTKSWQLQEKKKRNDPEHCVLLNSRRSVSLALRLECLLSFFSCLDYNINRSFDIKVKKRKRKGWSETTFGKIWWWGLKNGFHDRNDEGERFFSLSNKFGLLSSSSFQRKNCTAILSSSSFCRLMTCALDFLSISLIHFKHLCHQHHKVKGLYLPLSPSVITSLSIFTQHHHSAVFSTLFHDLLIIRFNSSFFSCNSNFAPSQIRLLCRNSTPFVRKTGEQRKYLTISWPYLNMKREDDRLCQTSLAQWTWTGKRRRRRRRIAMKGFKFRRITRLSFLC